MKKDKIQQLQISRFNYTLPDEKIAKYPLEHRDASKLLLYRGSRITSLPFADLPGQLPDNSLLLFNNTRVIHARLLFRKETGAHIEVFCLSPLYPADYALSFQQRQHCSWKCMIGNARRWKSGPLTMDIPLRGDVVRLTAQKPATLHRKRSSIFHGITVNIHSRRYLKRRGSCLYLPILIVRLKRRMM